MTTPDFGQDASPAFFIGDVALDEYFTADRWPGLGDKAMLQPLATYVGGSIANAAAVHAGYGAPTEFVSLLNRGEGSRRLCAELAAGGVGVAHMLHDETMPDSRTIVVLVDGEHAVLIPELGDAPMILPDATLAALRRPGFLYATPGRIRRLRASGMDALAVLRSAQAAGRQVVYDLDVEGVDPRDEPFLRGARAVIVNRIGFSASFAGWSDERIIEWMRRREIGMLAATLAAEGCRAYVPDRTIAVPGLAVSVVDVTGAGDTFGGSLVYALERTDDPAVALRFANAAGAASVTRRGPRAGVGSAANVLAFMAAHGQPGGSEFDCLRTQGDDRDATDTTGRR
ncbi:MAG: carbohydrate kinase family protein [Thermomicrobiales bacterium]|nr:carbohydrate kinase family protein [Thermomicrobiales bacterium]